MSVIVKGHASHKGTPILVIEGRAEGNNDTDKRIARESKLIRDFLRDNLPSGTLDMLAVRLASNALDHLISSDRLSEIAEAREIYQCLADRIKELDKEAK